MSNSPWLDRWLLRGISFSVILGSFFRVKSTDERVRELKDHLERLVKDFPSRDVTGDGVPETFCNIALHQTGLFFGFPGFKGLLANTIINRLKHDIVPGFMETSRDGAAAAALAGKWAIAGKEYPLHGHIATIYPAPMSHSASLGYSVPLVANIGKTNGIMRISQAFPPSLGEPAYWIYDAKE